MAARARLITGGKVLRGLRVNSYQWNYTAGIKHGRPVKPTKMTKVRRGASPMPPKGSVAKPHVCTICNKRFKTAEGRNAHRKAVHTVAPAPPAPSPALIPTPQPVPANKPVVTPTPVTPKGKSENATALRVAAIKRKLAPVMMKDRRREAQQGHVPCPVCGVLVGAMAVERHCRRAHAVSRGSDDIRPTGQHGR